MRGTQVYGPDGSSVGYAGKGQEEFSGRCSSCDLPGVDEQNQLNGCHFVSMSVSLTRVLPPSRKAGNNTPLILVPSSQRT